MLWGELLNAHEEPARCQACRRVASVEVFDVQGVSQGCYCLRDGERKVRELAHYAKLAKAIVRRTP
jgi:hypothetical protein